MIEELMIIDQAGIALFYHNFINNDRLDDEQSLASYFDIICRFTKNSFKESLRTLVLDSFIFFFYTHKSNYHLVLKCENEKYNKDVLESISEKIIKKFLLKYKKELKDFNGETSLFISFSEDIIEILSHDLISDVKTLEIIQKIFEDLTPYHEELERILREITPTRENLEEFFFKKHVNYYVESLDEEEFQFYFKKYREFLDDLEAFRRERKKGKKSVLTERPYSTFHIILPIREIQEARFKRFWKG